MPNENKIAPIKGKKFEELPYMDSAVPGKALPKKPYGGNFVKPEDRVANVSADAPKVQTESAPAGDLFTPDKSGISSIHDK